MKVLCVVPARSGSKRVKNKNLRLLNGKPLIYYSIKSALNSKKITNTYLSTDSMKIKKIGESFGLKIPTLRPKQLAKDSTLTIDVVKHAIKLYEKINSIKYDFILLLQPTCPFREKNLINNSINILLKNKKLDSFVTIEEVGSYHPFRMKYLSKSNLLSNVIEQGFEDMRPIQSIKKVYIRSGSIYLCKRSVVFEQNSLVGKNAYGHLVKGKFAINIDTIKDLNDARRNIIP